LSNNIHFKNKKLKEKTKKEIKKENSHFHCDLPQLKQNKDSLRGRECESLKTESTGIPQYFHQIRGVCSLFRNWSITHVHY